MTTADEIEKAWAAWWKTRIEIPPPTALESFTAGYRAAMDEVWGIIIKRPATVIRQAEPSASEEKKP